MHFFLLYARHPFSLLALCLVYASCFYAAHCPLSCIVSSFLVPVLLLCWLRPHSNKALALWEHNMHCFFLQNISHLPSIFLLIHMQNWMFVTWYTLMPTGPPASSYCHCRLYFLRQKCQDPNLRIEQQMQARPLELVYDANMDLHTMISVNSHKLVHHACIHISQGAKNWLKKKKVTFLVLC